MIRLIYETDMERRGIEDEKIERRESILKWKLGFGDFEHEIRVDRVKRPK